METQPFYELSLYKNLKLLLVISENSISLGNFHISVSFYQDLGTWPYLLIRSFYVWHMGSSTTKFSKIQFSFLGRRLLWNSQVALVLHSGIYSHGLLSYTILYSWYHLFQTVEVYWPPCLGVRFLQYLRSQGIQVFQFEKFTFMHFYMHLAYRFDLINDNNY